MTDSKKEALVPSFRLKEEADAKRAAIARAEAAEKRVKELEEELRKSPSMKTGVFEHWKDAHFGRPEDQPLIFAVLIVLIALTLWFFL
jgi:hypothetical protein